MRVSTQKNGCTPDHQEISVSSSGLYLGDMVVDGEVDNNGGDDDGSVDKITLEFYSAQVLQQQ